MKLSELIMILVEQLQECNPESSGSVADLIDGEGVEVDPEVWMAYQPNYPLEARLSDPVLVEGDDGSKRIYVGEAGGNGYCQGAAAEALGWWEGLKLKERSNFNPVGGEVRIEGLLVTPRNEGHYVYNDEQIFEIVGVSGGFIRVRPHDGGPESLLEPSELFWV